MDRLVRIVFAVVYYIAPVFSTAHLLGTLIPAMALTLTLAFTIFWSYHCAKQLYRIVVRNNGTDEPQ